jgi:hypothetical protein
VEELKLEQYHNMMNSTSVIKGMAELLLEEEGVPTRKDMLSVIVSRADKVADQLETLRNSR